MSEQELVAVIRSKSAELRVLRTKLSWLRAKAAGRPGPGRPRKVLPVSQDELIAKVEELRARGIGGYRSLSRELGRLGICVSKDYLHRLAQPVRVEVQP